MAQTGHSYDVVVGTGSAGLTAAIKDAKARLKVLMIEKEPVFGGTTATLGGVIRFPGNRYARALGAQTGAEHSIDAARRYLQIESGQYIGEPKLEAYLRYGPDMVDFMERKPEVKFYALPFPDYHPDVEGASNIRSLGSVEYSAGKMCDLMNSFRSELPQTLFLGLALGSSLEMMTFMAADRFITAMGFVLRRMALHFRDLRVEIWLSSTALGLLHEESRVTGVEVQRKDTRAIVHARHGVVLLAGGDPRAAHHPPASPRRWSLCCPCRWAIPATVRVWPKPSARGSTAIWRRRRRGCPPHNCRVPQISRASGRIWSNATSRASSRCCPAGGGAATKVRLITTWCPKCSRLSSVREPMPAG
jgi:succinate dehydrogenase/fumarate reductase flavoprotein subunit